MKKFNRNEQKRWIEKGKSAFILFLCFWCAWLLWSVVDLYKGQISISQFFWGADNPTTTGQSGEAASENVVQMFWQLSEPELVAATKGESRRGLLAEDQNYQSVTENINLLLQAAHSAKAENVLNGDMEQWKKALCGDSVYVRFAGERSTDFESRFYEMRDSSFSRMVSAYEDMVIVPDPAAEKSTQLLVRDSRSEKVVKILVEAENSAIKKAIGESEGVGKNCVFAFEEKSLASGINAEIDDMFVFFEELPSINGTLIRTPRIYKGGISFANSTEVTSGLVNVFGFNPNTVRQYANAEDALIFVAETGSLSLSPSGVIEYKALGENEGVPLGSKGKNNGSEYLVISGVSGIVKKVFDLCGINNEKNDAALRITKFPENLQSGRNTIEIDYFVDGIQAKVRNGAAISAVIENGVLVELNMCVKAIESLDNDTDSPEVSEALIRYAENHKGTKILWAKPIHRLENEEEKALVTWEIQGDL